MKKRTAVVYHSVMGSTERVAIAISEQLKGDLIKINDNDKANPSMPLMTGKIIHQIFRPTKFNGAISKIDLSNYDRIYIGSPCWNYTYTSVIGRLIKDGNYQGKEIVFFLTHDGGPGNSIAKFEKALVNAKFIGGMEFGSVRSMDDKSIKQDVKSKLAKFL